MSLLLPVISSTQADRRALGTPLQPLSAFDREKNPGAERAAPLGGGLLPKHRAREAGVGSGQAWCPPHPLDRHVQR